MTPEAKVKKKIRTVLEKCGAYYAMPVTGGYGASGVPDFLICIKGRFVAVEAKAGTNKPTALQVSNMKRIEDAGGLSIVINEHNVDQLETILRGMSYEN